MDFTVVFNTIENPAAGMRSLANLYNAAIFCIVVYKGILLFYDSGSIAAKSVFLPKWDSK